MHNVENISESFRYIHKFRKQELDADDTMEMLLRCIH